MHYTFLLEFTFPKFLNEIHPPPLPTKNLRSVLCIFHAVIFYIVLLHKTVLDLTTKDLVRISF